jgi:hypothetical protein
VTSPEPPPLAPQDSQTPPPISKRQWALAFVVLAYGVCAGFFWVLRAGAKADTAATYVGIPTLLAFLLATTPRARSRTGTILKGMTISLILVSVTLGPGVLCLLISAPLFLAIGAIVGRLLDAPMDADDRRLRVSVIAVALVLASIDGLHSDWTFDRRDTVTASRAYQNVTADQFRRRLERTPHFSDSLPFPLDLGFPAPVRAAGNGLEIGARRSVFLEDRNIYLTLIGKSGRQDGDVVFEVARKGTGPTGTSHWVEFRPVSDQSHVAKWLTWTKSTVRWFEYKYGTDPTPRLRVEWTVDYERRLAPSWYFGPILKVAAEAAAGLMIDTVAAQDD